MPERVLLIDDEEYVLRALRGYLTPRTESGEITVALAADGPAAVEKAKAAAAAGEPFDLAVIDFLMTDEMNGLETLQELRRHLPDITAIMLTGQAQQNTPMEALNLGFRHYLVKPATREAFLSAIDKQLREIRAAKEKRRLQEALARFHEAIATITATVQSVTDMTEPTGVESAAAVVLETAIAAASARDGHLLLFPENGPYFDVFDRSGAPVEGLRIPLGAGTAGMALATGGPMLRAAGDGGLSGEDLSPLEHRRAAVIAVPLLSASGRLGALLLADPADPARYPGATEAMLAQLGRLAALTLDAVRAQDRSRRLLLSALHTGLAHAGEQGDRLFEQVQASLNTLERPSSVVTAAAEAGLPEDTRIAAEMAAAIRDISAYGPEGTEFCRSMLTQLRALLKAYAG